MANLSRHRIGKVKSRLTRSPISAKILAFFAKALDGASKNFAGRLRFKSKIWPAKFLLAPSRREDIH